jgi:uncharacterized protein YdiU (UPF0061 family)
MQAGRSEAGWQLENTYAALPEQLCTPTEPTAVRLPRLVVLNEPLAAELGLDPEPLRSAAAVFAGNERPPGAEPIAQAYAGHQFGHFTNLGDGRAILLGEQITPDGRRVDIQLKGAGRTRYSRSGDGRAALGPMLREHLISEAMHALGIPSTRSLAVALTGEVVRREKPLPGAVLTRVAASHLRVGTFQLAAALGDQALLEQLLGYAVDRHDPTRADSDEPAIAFLEAVMQRQASLIAKWMLVGFVHGVMNTDNMAVSGETIDYGPCAFLDVYDPATVFSSIDQQGRYAFANQPAIAQWNLARLAESLLQVVSGDQEQAIEKVRGVLERFAEAFERAHLAGARAKLGLAEEHGEDRQLFDDLLASMQQAGADFTSTFVTLADYVESQGPTGCLPPGLTPGWLERWRGRLEREGLPRTDVRDRMQRANPVVIPRNHKVEEVLAAAEIGDLQPLQAFVEVLRKPFAKTPENEPYRGGPPGGSAPYRTFCGT